MITINGKKMGKSYGNFITLEELFTGKHPLLQKAYSPMTIRFFILQAHYRSTLDFSNEALQAAEKGLKKLFQAVRDTDGIATDEKASDAGVAKLYEDIYDSLCDELNTPVALSYVFEAVNVVNKLKDKSLQINMAGKVLLQKIFKDVLTGILGLQDEQASGADAATISGLMDIILKERQAARAEKNWAKCDALRDQLAKLGIRVKDTKEGSEWSLE
jgi:cysteinyl-tRNA synthetase